MYREKRAGVTNQYHVSSAFYSGRRKVAERLPHTQVSPLQDHRRASCPGSNVLPAVAANGACLRSDSEGQPYGTLREGGRWPFYAVTSMFVPALLSLIKMGMNPQVQKTPAVILQLWCSWDI